MSIAVRVSVWILGVLVAISAAVAVMALMQKQTMQGQNQKLHSEIIDDQNKMADLTTQVKKLQDTANDLNAKISQAQQEKTLLQSSFDDLKHKSDDLQAQLSQANADRDDWKGRTDTITRERDQLAEKLKNPPVKIVYKDRVIVKTVPAPATPAAEDLNANLVPPSGASTPDQYWAAVLKQKAALQMEVQKEKSDLDQAALQVVGLKKQNTDLQTQIKQLSNEKDEIVQKIKYGQDLADNLAVDLARSRNDQKAVNDRADRLKAENLELFSQIRGLNATKLDLEKTIARLTDDKDAMQKKLIETESIIQSRIDDIWKLKQSLDKKLAENPVSLPSPTPASAPAGGMELPPIIVNTANVGQQAASSTPSPDMGMKSQGSIISINESNNFIIADLGQINSSVKIGSLLKVYRDAQPVATLQVIQVRREICAADIQSKSAELRVGDVVRI